MTGRGAEIYAYKKNSSLLNIWFCVLFLLFYSLFIIYFDFLGISSAGRENLLGDRVNGDAKSPKPPTSLRHRRPLKRFPDPHSHFMGH